MNIILTGGHTGIGLELTKMLLRDGHKIGLIIRSEKRKNETSEALGKSENIDFFYADLSKRAEIEVVARQISDRWAHIDALFNNAGVLLDQAYYSEDDHEMHFQVNTLGPYYLTQELKPLLEKAPEPFVINTATGGLHNRKEIDIADLKRPKKFTKLLGSYLTSKLAMVALMNHLAVGWPEVKIRSVDPGPNKTNMTGDSGMPGWLLPIRNLLFPGPEKGARKLYQGAFADEFRNHSVAYITNGKVKPMKLSLTENQVAEMLSQVSA